jgi:tetratricopeptide (TPR) repeat protein
LVSQRKNKVGLTRLSGVLLVLCLFPGCAPHQSARDLYTEAVALRESGKDRLAVDKLNEAIKADPEFVPAYLEVGRAYEKLGEHERASAAFKRAATLAPGSVENYLNLAKTYEKLERYPQAVDAYARAVELDPNSLDGLAGAARCCVKSGQYARAQGYCARASGHQDELLPVLARAYEGQQDYRRAIDIYERLSATGPDPNVLLSLGVACLKAGRYDRAQEVLVSVTQMRPRDGTAVRHLGYCFIKRGDLEQAMQAYHKAVELDGGDWEAYRGLGVACMLKARQSDDRRWEEQALRHWRRSLVIKPDQPKHQILEKLIRENSKQQNPLQGLNY